MDEALVIHNSRRATRRELILMHYEIQHIRNYFPRSNASGNPSPSLRQILHHIPHHHDKLSGSFLYVWYYCNLQ